MPQKFTHTCAAGVSTFCPAAKASGCFALTVRLGLPSPISRKPEISLPSSAHLRPSISIWISVAPKRLATLVAKHSASIRAVAAALIEHRTLTGGEIVAVVAESVAREAMAAERARRLDWRARTESARAFLSAALVTVARPRG
jgi:hypothetical protein